MIDLGSPTTLFCPRHLKPLRAEWPYGYAVLMMAVFQHALREPEIVRAVGGDADRLGPVLREYGPLCCRMSDTDMERWTALALRPADDYDDTIAALRELERS